MALKSISLRGFRNLEPTSVDFAEGSNYLFGPNGAGKTNLLEAIHYLAIGRSFRRCPDADMLGFGRDVLAVSGTDESGDTAEIRFDGREKRILRNDIPVEKLSEYFGWLPVVVLLLEDIELVKGAPGIRRSFLDMAISKAGPSRKDSYHKDTKTQSGGQQKTEAEAYHQDTKTPMARTAEPEINHQDTKTQSQDGPKSEVRSQSAEGRSADGDSHHQDTKTPMARTAEPGINHQDTKTQSQDGPKSEVSRQSTEGRSCSSPQPSPHRGEGERSEGEEAVGGQRWADGGRREERSYITLISEYRRAVSQYNRLLERSGASREPVADQLAAWEEELVLSGVPVYEARLAKVGELLENAARHYERLAGHGAVFSYRSSIVHEGTRSEIVGRGQSPALKAPQSGTVPTISVMSPSDLAAVFRQRLAQTRERARALGHAVVGPHRDDIRITRGDRELRKFGSVGEQRLAGIALRLAEADMILSAGRQRPVFLLDEVASELDEQRSRMVLEMVAERGQMVYAAARRIAPPRKGSRDQGIEGSSGEPQNTVRDAASLDHMTTGPLEHYSGKEFHVEAGTVSEVS